MNFFANIDRAGQLHVRTYRDPAASVTTFADLIYNFTEFYDAKEGVECPVLCAAIPATHEWAIDAAEDIRCEDAHYRENRY